MQIDGECDLQIRFEILSLPLSDTCESSALEISWIERFQTGDLKNFFGENVTSIALCGSNENSNDPCLADFSQWRAIKSNLFQIRLRSQGIVQDLFILKKYLTRCTGSWGTQILNWRC